MKPSRFVTVKELAGIAGVTPRTVYRWLELRAIPEARRFQGRWYIPREWVERQFGSGRRFEAERG